MTAGQPHARSVAGAVAISDLRNCPDFAATIADRVWRAWWQAGGTPRAEVAARVTENLGPGPIPSAFVAHAGGCFLGTASAITGDMADRPQYSPWVAAVWVEPEARGRGIGAALVAYAADAIFRAGFSRAYLSAAPDRRSFYRGMGWEVLEDGIGEARMTVFIRAAVGEAAAGQT